MADAQPEARSAPPSFATATIFYSRFAEEFFPIRNWIEILFLFALFLFGAWGIRQQDFGFASMEWLRHNFFIFTREPLLQVYVYIFVETFVLKLGMVVLLIFYLLMRREPVLGALALSGPIQNFSKRFLYFFVILCVALSWWQGIDPLTPDLPTPLFFQESALLGNVLAVFSLAVVAPITEEIIFRGFLYPALCSRLGRLASIFLTTVVFTAAHAPQMNGDYGHLGLIFFIGALLTWQRASTGSTGYTIGLHAFYNIALTIAGLIRFCFYGL